jgi:hypothetical protein
VVIVVAGMDGALPGVTAGLVGAPVVAVPTSIGYGASFQVTTRRPLVIAVRVGLTPVAQQGIAALLNMLNSCASGVTVVNIDNGFGAAMHAAQILRMASRLQEKYSNAQDR